MLVVGEMKMYAVLSPEYGTVEVVLDDGTGPMVYGRDALLVEATSKRKAVRRAVRHWLGLNEDTWSSVNVSDNKPPWAGITAQVVSGEDADPKNWIDSFIPDTAVEEGK